MMKIDQRLDKKFLSEKGIDLEVKFFLLEFKCKAIQKICDTQG